MNLMAAPDPDHASVLFVVLLFVCILLLGKNRWLYESIAVLIIGLCTGVVILLMTKGKSSHLLVISDDLFFIYLLPPIIFNAGFRVKKEHFFGNFMTITLFGVFGTIISFLTISLAAIAIFRSMNIDTLDVGDFLAIGAILSATHSACTLQVLNQDETPFLYSLISGEGIVNHATSVVLFNVLQNFDLNHIDAMVVLKFFGSFLYLFVSSTFLGVCCGLLTAYMIKISFIGRHSTKREVAVMMLMAYLTYVQAEHQHLSGILAVFFYGIVISHYTWHSLTESSRVTTKQTFATLSFIAETFLFLYVVMDALDIEKWKLATDSPWKSIAVSSIFLGLVLVGRAGFVFPISFLSNLTKKTLAEKLCWRQQIIIWWAGLMRGAVSIALAYNKFTRSGQTQLQGNEIMITSTITVVLFSTMLFGMTTKPLIGFLLLAWSNATSDPTSPYSCTLVSFLPSNLQMLLTVRCVRHSGGVGLCPFPPEHPLSGIYMSNNECHNEKENP